MRCVKPPQVIVGENNLIGSAKYFDKLRIKITREAKLPHPIVKTFRPDADYRRKGRLRAVCKSFKWIKHWH